MINSLLIADYGVFWLLVWPIGTIFTILSQLESVISLKWGIIAMRGKVNTCSKTQMSAASTSEVEKILDF